MSLLNTPEITVNGSVIMPESIDSEIQYHPAATRREAMVSAAESLIFGKLILQKAIALGLTDLDENASLDAEQEYQLLAQIRQREEHLPSATESECRRYYEANKERFVSAPLVSASHILLAADPQDLKYRSQQQQLAEKLLSELTQTPGDFEEMAQRYSDCPSKTLNGDLGQITANQTVPEFERAVFASKNTGLIEFVIESRFGFHIVRVNQLVAGRQLPFAMVQEKIQDYLNERLERKSLSQYLHRMVAEADIQGFSFQTDQSTIMQ
ncbi:MAG: peptidylprolyl isomerase [Aestuariibacter sp.]